jgi:hypothetical protein
MALPLGNTILPGYEMPLGDKKYIVFDHTGPTSYTQFVPGTGVGGDVLLASGSGLNIGGFDYLDADTADSTGQIQAFPVFYLGGFGNATPQVSIRYYSLVTASLGGQSQVAGTEILAATNLSTFSWRFRALAV